MSLLNHVIPSLNRSAAAAPDLGATVKPVFEITEAADSYSLVAYLPGVAKENLEITGENSQLRVVGRRTWQQPEGWTSLYRESSDAPFVLNLEHANAVDVDKIQAELRDGVLRLSLPKAEALKPRKIAVA